jgi:uncharacterized protein (TIGR00730 family)
MKVAVFCSCSESVSPFFLSAIEELGSALAEDGHNVIYGGSSGGCMGALARGVQRRGGHLTGVLPQLGFMDGLIQAGLSEEHTVKGLSERKVKMNELADAFIVFPGGIGTLDEAFEVLALKSAGSLEKPIIFYNYMDVWTPLIEALKLLEEQRLIRQSLDDLLVVLDKPEQVRENLRR